MKTCCNFCAKLMFAFFALMLSMGSLQAQSQPQCDLSKCSPEERAACAKKCAVPTALTTASLVNFLLAENDVEKPSCKPIDCQKPKGATAKLVSTTSEKAPNYSANLDEVTKTEAKHKKKKSCAAKCRKAKASL